MEKEASIRGIQKRTSGLKQRNAATPARRKEVQKTDHIKKRIKGENVTTFSPSLNNEGRKKYLQNRGYRSKVG